MAEGRVDRPNRFLLEGQDTVTETSATTPTGKVVDSYFAMWNETDSARRRAAIAAAWSHDASYLDPMLAADGLDALDAMVVGVHERFPGHHFRLTGAIDTHHDRARWGWEFVGPAGGPPLVAGVDFAVLAPDGRLRQVTGFFERPADAA